MLGPTFHDPHHPRLEEVRRPKWKGDVWSIGASKDQRDHCTEWLQLREPLGRQHMGCGQLLSVFATKRAGGPGPEVSFISEMLAYEDALIQARHRGHQPRPRAQLGVIKFALGGASMDVFAPPANGAASTNRWPLLSSLLHNATRGWFLQPNRTGGVAMRRHQCIRVRGLVWFSGERESLFPEIAPNWLPLFARLVSELRRLVDNQRLAVVVTRTLQLPVEHQSPKFGNGSVVVRAAQMQAGSTIPHADWVDIDGLDFNVTIGWQPPVGPPQVAPHLTISGLLDAGLRMGRAMRGILERRGIAMSSNESIMPARRLQQDETARIDLAGRDANSRSGAMLNKNAHAGANGYGMSVLRSARCARTSATCHYSE